MSGVTQSVELLLDDAAERTVLERWRRLQDAGLPSMARHTGATNRPHITLGVADAVPARTETELRSLVPHLPVTVTLGGLVVFGNGRERVLAWLVVPSAALLELHARTAALWPSGARHLRPGAWTPHVTLARHLPLEQLGEVLTALGELPELGATGRSLRRWDSDARRAWVLDR